MSLQRRSLQYAILLSALVVFALSWGSAGCNPTVKNPDGIVQKDGGTGDSTTVVDTIKTGCKSNTDCTDPTKPFCTEGVCSAQKPCTADTDCTDPTRPKCINGTCDALPGCTDDSGCPDPTNPVCKEGVCVPKTTGCKTDDDCKSDPNGTTCLADGKCGPAPGCTTDTDCKTKERPTCEKGTCVPAKAECQRDADCVTEPKKTICNIATGKCEEPAPKVCKSDADCVDPSLPVCNTKTGKCEAAPGCKDNADCKDPTLPVCRNGACGPECVTDKDCKDPKKNLCVAGVCSELPPECTSDADCSSADKPKCDTKAGKCIPAPPECKTNTDCKDPKKPICAQGKCTPKSGCKSDKDCASTPKTPRCELGTGKCQVCVRDNNCKSYQFCDVKTYTCVTRPGACASDVDCRNPATPSCVNNKCVACAKDTDCKPLQKCQTGACVYVGCSNDKECAPQVCNSSTKACVECVTNTHCKTGFICKANKCEIKKCGKDSDCKQPTPACNTTSGACVECTDAAKHCGPGAKCVKNACVSCTKDSECTRPNSTPAYIPGSTQICLTAKCADGCRANTDCALGNICKANKCVEGCVSNRDCPTNSACQAGKCVRTCGSNRECFNSNNERVCDTTARKCVQCRSNGDCQRYYGQSFGRQRPVCDTKTNTCGCGKNTDCRTASNAVRGVCDTSKKICLGCKGDTDCRRGFICNKSNVCIAGCRTDNECVRGTVCNTNTNKCTQCNTNKDCSAPTPACDKFGRCVGCLTDKDCAAGNKCDATSLTCYKPGSKEQCQSCSQNSDCRTGYNCTTARFNSGRSEKVCTKKCNQDSDCPQGMSCGSFFNPRLQGVCYPRSSNSNKSCKAVVDQGKTCTASSGCGLPGVNDSSCSTIQGGVCVILCTNNNQCSTGYKCGCPAGYTSVFGGRYCRGVQGGSTPARCVKK